MHGLGVFTKEKTNNAQRIRTNGKQNFMGKEMPIILGGFGEGKKCICDKTIAEIHNQPITEIRRRVNDNISRFKENIDFIDLKIVVGENHNNLLDDLGYTHMQISKAEHIYLLSERGYAKLIKIMDTDLAWEIHDKLIDEYFEMREMLKDSLDKEKLEQAAFVLKCVAEDLKVNDASRLLMYEGLCKDFNIPTAFLPKYEHNGSREMKAPSHLLEENGCDLSAVKFNILLMEQGYLEEKERPSSKGEKKKFKALTESGLKYGENAVNPHNQKEVQPLYYSDTFMELYYKVTS